MPTSQRSSSPSQSSASSTRRPTEPAPLRRQRSSHRPERYEVTHRPRRVIRAGEKPSFDERAEYSEEEYSAAPEEARRAPRASLWKRVRRMGLGPWEWIGLGVSCVACAFLLREIVGIEGDHQMLRGAVHQKEVQLAALEKQNAEEKKKLAYLQSEKGRDQILAQRGFLKPGDRILLFPSEPQTENESTR